MSAAQWRKAMNSGAASAARPVTAAPVVPLTTQEPAERGEHGELPRWMKRVFRDVGARHVVVMLGLLLYPLVANGFFTFQVGAQSLALGLVALSLTFLGGYGGMVSVAQMTVAGVAGYLLAIFGSSSATAISLGWPWWLAAVFAIALATVFATLVGWLSVRTEGIYTIMITLAIGVAFFYLAQQNYSLFNGHQGFNKLFPPTVLDIDFREATPFYYLSLACALAGYFFVKLLVRAPFGVALQGIRDNPRRMNSLGYNVTAHRVAAYAVAGLLAAVGGVLLAWYNNRISPGSMNTGAMINILVIAVLGGMNRPIGAFIGAVVFVLLQNFAVDLVDRERFNLVIGGVFLAIVLFSPNGLVGIWTQLRARLGSRKAINPRRRLQ
ncbi:branched-chain amino acid ABC transporter permease [Ramlibacter ginsenosidimutans]|uniref:Branched-chain amino acid ABC transporter permease n=1 Tax=Ramlibacter ginsenosidimutans TaxID=502333 RepID=A0A934WLK6_9BURK|nr:branched-chain amino acid ABC transporter permease [Ramlibacter ginsenosidimutans]MBK6005676.1 branched-chain amino acid ABC transporter permease [Ramlibacter ginsenosidimutans]